MSDVTFNLNSLVNNAPAAIQHRRQLGAAWLRVALAQEAHQKEVLVLEAARRSRRVARLSPGPPPGTSGACRPRPALP